MSEIQHLFTEERFRTVALKCDVCGAEEDYASIGSHYMTGGTVLVIGGGCRSIKPGPDARMDLCAGCAKKLIDLFPVIAQERGLQYTTGDLVSIL